jgi:hypothetical protein
MRQPAVRFKPRRAVPWEFQDVQKKGGEMMLTIEGVRKLKALLAAGQPLPKGAVEEVAFYIKTRTAHLQQLEDEAKYTREFLDEALALARAIGKTKTKKGGD